MSGLDSIDRRILNILQADFPLIHTPFESIAQDSGITEEEVIERINRLKRERIIRQIGAIFDTRSLGYKSSLVAAEISADDIDRGVEFINSHPGVSHNYLRDDRYNLWFTIAVPPNSRLGLKKSVEILMERARVKRFLLLPALRLFKISFKLDMDMEEDTPGSSQLTEQDVTSNNNEDRTITHPFFDIVKQNLSDNDLSKTEEEIFFIRILQRDLPIVRYPFEELGKEYRVDSYTLIQKVVEFIKKGRMRRFAAILNHHKSGYDINVMGAWIVPKGSIEEVGNKMASFKAVTHCYLRPTYPDWPYNIFTMIHSRSHKECDSIFLNISRTTGITNYRRLYTNRELKKIRLQYFSPELEEWEREYL